MKKVLVIEDDLELVNLIEIHLKDLGFKVLKAHDGQEGLNKAIEEIPDLITLDVSMPKMDGFEVCKAIRQSLSVPIIMVTAKTEEIDRVLGLEIGADDYITKPFSIREFTARVKAILRRSRLNKDLMDSKIDNQIYFEGLSINVEKRKVSRDGKRVELSPKEFELLVLMASNPGNSYSRSQLLSLIWGYDFEGYEHTVNSHINRLRSKIEPNMNKPKYILTSWGVGYKFNEDIDSL